MSFEKVLRFLTAASISASLLVLVLLYRLLRRSAADVPYARHAAAALALSLGVLTLLAGVGHSVAVVSLALSATQEYGPLVILRFTTGAMLLYSGAMNIAVYRAIRAGRPWAVGIGAATCLLFSLYLLFLLPLPGTGGTAWPMLGLWIVYLPVLGAAALRSRRQDGAQLGLDPRA